LFAHPNSYRHAEQYFRGLLAPIERKNGWTIAEFVGEKEPKAMQRFLNLAFWDADALRDLVCDYAIEHLNDPGGILVADPTGFAKKGRKSAGVQRQYSGTLGRIDNCQIGTFLAYVSSSRDRVLIDRELYIPQGSWFGDPGPVRRGRNPGGGDVLHQAEAGHGHDRAGAMERSDVCVVHRGRRVRPKPGGCATIWKRPRSLM
jgi:hypothetical protein